MDSEQRIVYANPALCELSGYPRDRLLGQDGFAFIPERQRQSAQTHWEDVRERLAGSVTTGTGVIIAVYQPAGG